MYPMLRVRPTHPVEGAKLVKVDREAAQLALGAAPAQYPACQVQLEAALAPPDGRGLAAAQEAGPQGRWAATWWGGRRLRFSKRFLVLPLGLPRPALRSAVGSMRRGAVLAAFALAYAGYLLLGALIISAVERPYESQLRAELRDLKSDFLRHSPCLSEATLERFLGAVLSANRHSAALLRNGSAAASNWDFASAFFFASTLITTVVPAAIFSSLEESWSFLDAFYFCFISLCTIGLGDYVPGEQPGQRLRPLYKISVTVYLLLGLMAMLLILQTFHKLADLHGLSDLVFLSPDQPPEEHQSILEERSPPSEPGQRGTLPAHPRPGGQAQYSSINR
ncbi:potassium channel subfamily K member 6 isoform X2 [Python bivittatus]|uniref:Potassium channel subfamily K member 6 isoform X2 n=1 Tax=Python bivittatus TaxID=176946 RepID=A0A9F3W276_PYTBI|nr:potassium channel subfamily K member 6 isoform X2 [Python bivittatus]